MSVGYAVAYRLGITPWESAGEAAQASFDALLDREERDHGPTLGRVLDIGCGRGSHTHELAGRGWEAVGLDNISRAIDAARARTDSGATFVLGDVTRLDPSTLGTFDFFLDIGCFHGLSAEQRRAEAEGVTALAGPGATMLMLAFRPNRLPMLPGGATTDDIESAFAHWDLLSTEPADVTGMPKPLQATAPSWYRLRLRD